MTMEIISETIDETLDKDKLKKKLRSLQNRYWTRLLWPLHCSVRIYIYSTSHTQAGWYKEKTDVDIVYYR